MKTYGYILVSNNGNHSGFNRKWENFGYYSFQEARAKMKEIAESLEELQSCIFVATVYSKLPKKAYCIDDFNGGWIGYAPKWLQQEEEDTND